MNTNPETGTAVTDDSLARASWLLGIIALVGLFVPPGLFVAPVAGPLAIVFGAMGMGQAGIPPQSREKAMLGMVLGLVATLVSLAAIIVFRHVIWHALDEANTWR